MVIGSRARSDHPADQWSDLDTIAFVDDSSIYAQKGGWQINLAQALEYPLWFAAYSHTGRGDPEWEFVLSEGFKVDIVFLTNPAPQGREASLSEMAARSPYRYVFERGVRVLVDQDPASRPFIVPTSPPRPVPDQAAFDNTISNILLDLTRAAKLARRGELWRAARALNGEMQANLLSLIEWHARAGQKPGDLAWYYGRFLEEWADPRILAELPHTHTANTLVGVRLALNASLDLLAWLGPETARRLDLRYPAEAVQQTAPWLRGVLD